jgi:hypothetical protein
LYHIESTRKNIVTLLKSSSTKTEVLVHRMLHIISFGGPMNWFKGNTFSNKNVSLVGGFVFIVVVALSMTVSKEPKKFLSKKQNAQSHQVAKKVLKKIGNTKISKKYIAKIKSPFKKNLAKHIKIDMKRAARDNFLKKNIKEKPIVTSSIRIVKLRPNVTLSMDSWNHQHEQVETLKEKLGDDPVGAARFEESRVEEELAAAGI